ncbi:MAG: AMP-binding protein [Saprospiraceae bacterium]|nr:AMP-binding protein [Saprospiraceae bacterium]
MYDQRPWLKNYPNGVPANIDPGKYESLVEFLEECFKKYAEKPAFTCMGKTLTFHELDVQSKRFGAYLHSRGLKPGDRIAMMMPNLLQYPVTLFGALRAGLIVVNTNPLYTPREMLHQFTDSKVTAIVIAENFAHNLEKILPKTEINTIIITSIGEMLGWFKGALVNFAVRKLKRMVPRFDLPNTVTVSEAVSQGKKFSLNDFENCSDDVIFHQYTGGTTGIAKGAMLTNRNMIANMLQIRAWIGTVLEEGKETAMSPLPMYHIFALAVNVLAMMSLGARTLLIVNARDLDSILKAWKKHEVSLMTGVNTLFNGLMNHSGFSDLDFSHLKVTVGGGMAVQRDVAERWKEVTGCELAEGYGMTEASPVVTVNPIDGTARLGTIGLPVPSTDVRIMGEDDQEMAAGQPGELQVKGPQVMLGYYNQPDETSTSIQDGWLKTGDIGLMEESGFFKIVDRKKDMILVSGFNVYPNEIEDIATLHPKVMEAAAIGIPDDKSGEVVKLFVVKKDKSLKEKELMEHCREHLTGYKLPKVVEFRKELPKTNVGKILRRKLKEEEDQKA